MPRLLDSCVYLDNSDGCCFTSMMFHDALEMNQCQCTCEFLRLALVWLMQDSRSNVTKPSGFIFRYSTSCNSQKQPQTSVTDSQWRTRYRITVFTLEMSKSQSFCVKKSGSALTCHTVSNLVPSGMEYFPDLSRRTL